MSDVLVELAVATIEAHIKRKPDPVADMTQEIFYERHGAFVSIHKKDGSLRGCIGTILPTKDNLADEIIANAKSASTSDFRFEPISEDELLDLVVNVDVLSEPEFINDINMLDPKIYGVIVANGNRKGVLLPDLEGVDTVKEQIVIAMQKAGIAIEEPVELYRFTVDRHI